MVSTEDRDRGNVTDRITRRSIGSPAGSGPHDLKELQPWDRETGRETDRGLDVVQRGSTVEECHAASDCDEAQPL